MKIKKTFKKSYRAIKKSVQKMIKKLGFNKKEVKEATTRTLNAIELEISHFLNQEMKKVDLLSTPNNHIEGLIKPLKPEPTIKQFSKGSIVNSHGYDQDQANKYKEMITELNSLFAKENLGNERGRLSPTKLNHNKTVETDKDESYSI